MSTEKWHRREMRTWAGISCFREELPKVPDAQNVPPATAEAFMVNYIDDLDAKMNQVANLIDNDPGNTNWTAYQRPLETKLYRPRPLSQEE